MNEDAAPLPVRKTPADATEFEREQLRFFLGDKNFARDSANAEPVARVAAGAEEVGGVDYRPPELAAWIEPNFNDLQAIGEVAANMLFFNEDSGRLLEEGLNRKANSLPPLVLKSWRLFDSGDEGGTTPQIFRLVPAGAGNSQRRYFPRRVRTPRRNCPPEVAD